jgi:hypothetical protein
VVGLVIAVRYLRVDVRRLLTSAAVGAVVALLIVLPFDLESRAPPDLAGVPVLEDAAGLVTIVGQQANKDGVLVANAFTPWALVGPNPLPRSGISHWTGDGLLLWDGVTAFTVGLSLAAVGFLVGGALLLLRPDRPGTHLAIVVFLIVALFLLPTRIHERYVYPALVIAAPLAAVSWRWRGWYALIGLATAVNLHAVLTYGGTLGITSMPLGHDVQTPTVITAVAVIQGALGVVLAGLVIGGVGSGSLAGRTLAGVRGGLLRTWFPPPRATTPSSAPPA